MSQQQLLLAISGHAYSGKTTLAHELYKVLAQGRTNLLYRSIAEPIKRNLWKLTGFTETDDNKEAYRQGYQWYGNFMRQEHGEDYWARVLIQHSRFILDGSNIIVDDLRLPAEFEQFRSVAEGLATFFAIRLNITPEEQQRRAFAKTGRGIEIARTLDYTETALDNHLTDFDLNMDAEMPTEQQVSLVLDMLRQRDVTL